MFVYTRRAGFVAALPRHPLCCGPVGRERARDEMGGARSSGAVTKLDIESEPLGEAEEYSHEIRLHSLA